MKLYKDSDYKALAGTLAVPPIKEDQIRAASLNLKIGKIYVPGTENETTGSVAKPKTVFSLKQGATAVLKTSQEICLSDRQIGIMFPPNNVSLKGLLMTNPGHVDPGYKGHLHVTVINMGSTSYELRAEDQVIRLMIFELDDDVSNPYSLRSDPVTEELLSNLSFDFFDISNRIKKEIENQERKTKFLMVGVPILTTILGVASALFLSYSQLGERLAKLEATSSVTKQSDELKAELQLYSQRLSDLEKRNPKK